MPATAPSTRPTSARTSVISRLSRISLPLSRSIKARPTAAGGGRKAGSTRPEWLRRCQSTPKPRSGAARPSAESARRIGSGRRIVRGRGQRLPADGKPDVVADTVEGVREEQRLARDGAVEVDGELLDEAARP